MLIFALPRWRPRSGLVPVLGLILVLITALAWQARNAERSHRTAVLEALQDHAEFAGMGYMMYVESEVYSGLSVMLRPLLAPAWRGRVPDLESARALVREDMRRCGCVDTTQILAYLRYHLADGMLDLRGLEPSSGVRAWLITTLYGAAVAPAGGPPVAATVARVDGENWLLAHVIERDTVGRPISVAGALSRPAVLRPALSRVLKQVPFLPPVQAGGVTNESLLEVVVTDPTGDVIFGPRNAPVRQFSVQDTLDARRAGLVVRVGLRPEAVDRLVIGGVPGSRSPFLYGLMVVTVALVVVALLQLRREQELARLRADFVAGVSHELRTPLAQIRLFVETLRLGRVRTPAERARSLEIIDQEARRLTNLVENVLQFSRTERRVNRLSRTTYELAGLVRSVVKGFAPLAASRRVRVETDLEEGVAALVDQGALRQILINFLENAVKYGPAGQTVLVGMALFGSRAHLWVDDEGPGIAPRDRQRIFEPFTRLPQAASAGAGGSGIGLTVVRELATLHGGRVWAEDAPGGGARFVLELPDAELVLEQPGAEARTAEGAAPTGAPA